MRALSFSIVVIAAFAVPAFAQTTPPAEWTCNAGYYGSDDGCDCGCGAADPDCATATLASCRYNQCATDGQVPSSGNPATCVANACGDGVVDGTEVCDDGGAAGCAADCSAVDAGFDCGGTFDAFAGCHQVVCGDGIIDGDETCEDDDGASPAGGDGCSATCTLEDGFRCGAPGEACTPVPAGWTCSATWYGDAGCDCGCGAIDIDCTTGGCAEPGCTEASCEYCVDATGALFSCTGEGEGEGEGEPGEGEGEGEPGEGEGEGDDNGRDLGGDPEPTTGCASTRVTTGAPAALAVLLGAALLLGRRRR
ncbi:MAG: hypothetical protein HYS27_21035 [Deltaproteobacteria bacterium]|nr:hypothetical protein [Deltaproteobacteria bacterium]